MTNTSSVIGLGGTRRRRCRPPAARTARRTRLSASRGLLPIVCNADEIAGAAAVREALDVFVLQVGRNSLLKETTAASRVAQRRAGAETPAPQCSDGVDNDGDGVIDAADPGCHTDGNANNPASFDPTDNDETNVRRGRRRAATRATAAATTVGDGGDAQCSDGRDNDGDGVIDADDPGCHTDGNPNNPASYDPNDDSEGGGGGGGGAGDLDAARCRSPASTSSAGAGRPAPARRRPAAAPAGGRAHRRGRCADRIAASADAAPPRRRRARCWRGSPSRRSCCGRRAATTRRRAQAAAGADRLGSAARARVRPPAQLDAQRQRPRHPPAQPRRRGAS